MARLNFVACWTGSSAGTAPLRIRPTYSGRLRDKQQRRRHSSSGRRQRRTFYGDISQEFYVAMPTLKSCCDCAVRRKEERHRRRTRRLRVPPESKDRLEIIPAATLQDNG